MTHHNAFVLTVIPSISTEEIIGASLMVLSRGLPATSLDSCFQDLNDGVLRDCDKADFIEHWDRYLTKIQWRKDKLHFLSHQTLCFPEADEQFTQALETFYAKMGSLVALEMI